MTTDDILTKMDLLTSKAREIMEIKQHMYAEQSEAFKNFEVVHRLTGIPPHTQMLARMVDKLYRLNNFDVSGTNRVTRDSVEDAVIDLINYAVLYFLFIEEKYK